MNTYFSSNKYSGILLGGVIGDTLGMRYQGLSLAQIKDRGIKSTFPDDKEYSGNTELTIVLGNHLLDSPEIDTVELHTAYKSVVSTSQHYYVEAVKSKLCDFNIESTADSLVSGDSIARLSPLAMITHNSDNHLLGHIKSAVYYTHGHNRHVIDSGFIYVKLLKALAAGRFVTYKTIYNYIKSHARRNDTIYPLIKLMGNLVDEENIVENLYGQEIHTTKATQCLVCAIYCFLAHFDKPLEAIERAANMGGINTHIIAKLVGEMVGAYHGVMWIPEKWNSPQSEVELLRLGNELSNKQSQ